MLWLHHSGCPDAGGAGYGILRLNQLLLASTRAPGCLRPDPGAPAVRRPDQATLV
jgi:hypothetical protein